MLNMREKYEVMMIGYDDKLPFFMWYRYVHVVPLSSRGTGIFMWYRYLHVVPVSSRGTGIFICVRTIFLVNAYY